MVTVLLLPHGVAAQQGACDDVRLVAGSSPEHFFAQTYCGTLRQTGGGSWLTLPGDPLDRVSQMVWLNGDVLLAYQRYANHLRGGGDLSPDDRSTMAARRLLS